MVSPKSLDNFKGFKIEFICFQEYPPCKLTRQKRWPLGDLLLHICFYIKRNVLSNSASLYLAPEIIMGRASDIQTDGDTCSHL